MMTELELGPGWRKVSLKEYGPFSPRERIVHYVNAKPEYWVYEDPVPPLPTEPGTVIRTGRFWWLKCETYVHPDGTPGNENAWLLIPHQSQAVLRAMRASDLAPGCIYDQAMVLDQVAEYGFEALAEPRDTTLAQLSKREKADVVKAALTRVREVFNDTTRGGRTLSVTLGMVAREYGVENPPRF